MYVKRHFALAFLVGKRAPSVLWWSGVSDLVVKVTAVRDSRAGVWLLKHKEIDK